MLTSDNIGPPGCSLQTNIINLWRSHFVLAEEMLEVDCMLSTGYEIIEYELTI
jgi:glycyl-tRNA synthetase